MSAARVLIADDHAFVLDDRVGHDAQDLGETVPTCFEVRFALFGASPKVSHGVDVSAHLDRGIASLEAHRAYLDALPDGTAGKDPETFLRSIAEGQGPLLGVEAAVTFELVNL